MTKRYITKATHWLYVDTIEEVRTIESEYRESFTVTDFNYKMKEIKKEEIEYYEVKVTFVLNDSKYPETPYDFSYTA